MALQIKVSSAHHFRLALNAAAAAKGKIATDPRLIAASSSNGTKVNGSRVSEQRLDPGDTLSVAKHEYELNYEPSKLGATAAAPEKAVSRDPFSRSLLETAGLESRQIVEARSDKRQSRR